MTDYAIQQETGSHYLGAKAAEPMRPMTIDTAAEDVRHGIEKLAKLVDVLRTRTRPVRRETDPSPEDSNVRGIQPYASPICSHLMESVRMLDEMQGQVSRLIDTLDIDDRKRPERGEF